MGEAYDRSSRRSGASVPCVRSHQDGADSTRR